LKALKEMKIIFISEGNLIGNEIRKRETLGFCSSDGALSSKEL